MAAVGMIYNPVPEDPARWARPQGRAPRFQARYVAGLEGQASLAEPLRKQAAQVGMDRAERWIAISDAGAGVEDLLRVNFGRVEAVILDFYHAAEHLGDLGRALYPGDEATPRGVARAVVPPAETRGGRGGAGGVAGAAARTAARRCGTSTARWWATSRTTCIGWTTRAYQAKGWAIGSGPIESACKTVIGKRMKNGGMRWGEDGADEMCHLRALFASGEKQWDAYWHPSPN